MMKALRSLIEWLKSYALQNALAEDQAWNARFGGMADETLSARAHRMHAKGRRSWPRNLINALFFWQEDHCFEAYMSEMQRKHLPADYTETS